MEMQKAYNAKDHEERIYQLWERSGAFSPDFRLQISDCRLTGEAHGQKSKIKNLKSKIFSIVMPPPNANGSLHLGHALYCIQDIMTRYHRMKGDKTLYLPGADHAGFETQVVYDKKLEKEGRRRGELSREELYKEILQFTLQNKRVMESQLRKLGMSCDWSREKFTLDPDVVKVVYHTFKCLYEDGLVYRENRLVNWCVKHQTTLSDLEVKHEDRTDALYYLNYGPLTVATVRPEPIFADVAVAVHPKDKRYAHLVGKTARIPLINKEIPIIADESVDPKFGTGAVKVTPSVDHNDFALAQKHGLPIIPIIDQFGRLTDPAPEKYRGMKVKEAREAVAADIKAAGLLQEIDEQYNHAVAVCYKCKTVLEPRLLPQWYVAMTKQQYGVASESSRKSGRNLSAATPRLSLRDAAVAAVKRGEVQFIPKRMEKIFMHWMKNLRDWNISRQIVWGIRIPAWFHAPLCIPKPGVSHEEMVRCKEMVISETEPTCEFCDAKYAQDPDVFDTWFSSGQWPFATLLSSRGNPKSEIRNPKNRIGLTSEDFEQFYPTTMMETGWDIIFFWVARMVMLGLYATGASPFKTVYLHGLVRDKDRQKMSKSKGNVIDPLGVIDLYGADALRMALVVGNTAGNDIIISEEKIKGYRNFANKIWNAARFVMENCDKEMSGVASESSRRSGRGLSSATPEDRKILKELEGVVKKVTRDLEAFRFHHAGETLYHYFWHTFCDQIIESQKARLQKQRDHSSPAAPQDDKDRMAARFVLWTILVTSLKLLHPFMPFVTEAIWQEIRKGKGMLMVERWPKE